jgi:LCP family protein required for cell wall assembly
VGIDGPRPDAPGVTGLRTDSIMVVRVVPAERRVQVVSIPRDVWVPIAGAGREGRINEALGEGGPATLVGTVEAALDIPIDRYLQVDFDGFRELVDAAGGVRLDVTHPMRDATTGLDLTPGCQTFDGRDALALVRSRHVEWESGGRWYDDPYSDFGRNVRQHTFGRAVLVALGDLGSDPVERARLLDLFADHVTMDQRWTREELEGLVALAGELGPDDVSSRNFPVRPATRGSAHVLLPEGEALAGVTASLRGEGPDPHPGAAESPSTGPVLRIC